MKFIHIADCHIGGWRDPKMKDLPVKSFINVVDKSLEYKIDFMLISGDFFNSSHPTIDDLKTVVTNLKRLKDNDISVYIIAGSHDFSATGKTMLDVLEEAGLVINVVKGEVVESKLRLKFTVNNKTNTKITGMIGKKGSLETKYYDSIDKSSLENEAGFKIFMFHTAITELKPKHLEKMDSSPISLLPKSFDYYAGGHVHIVEQKTLEGYNNIIYPGPLFPNNFRELEELGCGGYYLYQDGKISYEKIELISIEKISFDATHKTPETYFKDITDEIRKKEFEGKIVLMRFEGELKDGKPSDIDFNTILKHVYGKGAYFVMRNTSKLKLTDFEDIQIVEDSVDKIEEKLINEHKGQINIFDDEKKVISELIHALAIERGEDEKVNDYETKVFSEVDRILDL